MSTADPLPVNIVGGTGRRLLLLVHGYGADEHDLAPLAPMYDPEGRFFAVCPRGPLDVPPWGAGWYERDAAGRVDPHSFLSAVDRLDATIDDLCASRGFQRDEAVVIGFSQGGAMTLALSLRAGGGARPSAIACLSGMLQEPEGLRYAWDAPDLPPVLVQHGTLDPLVEIARGHHVRDTLAAHGLEVSYAEYPMGHEIRPEGIADLRRWLADR